ncbi:peptidase [Citrobacter freundii]|nr:peptidase [Citrobacter freundii]
MTTRKNGPELLALCFEIPFDSDDALPEWLPVIPAGRFSGRDGRSWVNNQPHEVVTRSKRYPALPVDMEHATEIKGPKGEEAFAYGWIREYRVAEDGRIDARVEWTEEGAAIIRAKKYRYYSPAFFFTTTGEVIRLSSVGLTNKPNLDFPALNQESTMPLPVQIVTALGLAETASADDAVTAITQLKNNEQVALNRAASPDLTKFVPTETYQLALNRAETAENTLKEQAEKAAETLVDAAIEAGKIAPANREMYLATCRSEAGLQQFASFIKTAQPLVNNDKPTGGKSEKSTTLTETELAMCRSMGITQEEFLATRPEQE